MLFTFNYGEIFQYELIFMFRILLAMLLGGIIGAERERKNRSAGFRTHILVTVGSCMFMIVSISMPMMISTMPNGIVNNADPGRIAAQVVSGIGFLGAGAIMQDKGKVRGLTTAASLWVVAAIGLAIGAGMYFSAISTTFFLFLILSVFAKFEEKTMRKAKAKAEKKRYKGDMEEVVLCVEHNDDDSIDLKCIE